MRLTQKRKYILPLMQKQSQYITASGGPVPFWTGIATDILTGKQQFDIHSLLGAISGTLYLDPEALNLKDGALHFPPMSVGRCVSAVVNFMGRETASAIDCATRESSALLAFENAGRKIYEVAPGLAQRLAHTDIRGVDCANVRLPYPAILIRIPPESGLNVDEVVVVENSREYVKHASGMLRLKGEGSLLNRAMEKFRPPGSTDYGRSFGVFGTIRDSVDDVVFSAFILLDGVTVDALDALNHDFANDKTRTDGQNIELAARLTTFAMNLVLYLSWPDANEEFEERVDPAWLAQKRKVAQLNGYKKERAKARLKEMDPDRRIYVGAKVPFLSGGPEAGGTGDKLLVRTLVSGHWKMQPCGPKHAERKLIRVEPYWKGPVDGALSNPVRKVS